MGASVRCLVAGALQQRRADAASLVIFVHRQTMDAGALAPDEELDATDGLVANPRIEYASPLKRIGQARLNALQFAARSSCLRAWSGKRGGQRADLDILRGIG